jgi:hypothetical protein
MLLTVSTLRAEVEMVSKVSSRFGLALRLVCLRECGRFHVPGTKQCEQSQPCAREVRCSVGRAVCTHWKHSTRVSAAPARAVRTHPNGIRSVTYISNVAIEWLTYLLRRRKDPGSNLGPRKATRLKISSDPSGKCRNSALNLGHGRSLQNYFQFIFHVSSFIRRSLSYRKRVVK